MKCVSNFFRTAHVLPKQPRVVNTPRYTWNLCTLLEAWYASVRSVPSKTNDKVSGSYDPKEILSVYVVFFNALILFASGIVMCNY